MKTQNAQRTKKIVPEQNSREKQKKRKSLPVHHKKRRRTDKCYDTNTMPAIKRTDCAHGAITANTNHLQHKKTTTDDIHTCKIRATHTLFFHIVYFSHITITPIISSPCGIHANIVLQQYICRSVGTAEQILSTLVHASTLFIGRRYSRVVGTPFALPSRLDRQNAAYSQYIFTF